MELPPILKGHWTSPGGHEMATRYVGMTRSDLGMSDRSDLQIANDLYLAHGDIPIQTAAKERMRWLSVQLAIRTAHLAKAMLLLGEARGLIGDLVDVAPMRPAPTQVVVEIDRGMVQGVYVYGAPVECVVLDSDTDQEAHQPPKRVSLAGGEPFDAFVHKPQVKVLAERFVLPEDPTR